MGAQPADELLTISNACDMFAGIVAATLKERHPSMDLAGWLPALSTELFAACQDAARCVAFGETHS